MKKPTVKQLLADLAAGGGPKKKTPKTDPARFESIWRTSHAERLGITAGRFTGKEKGQAKHIINKLADLTPEMTDEQRSVAVQTFAQWVVLEWEQIAEVLKVAGVGHVPAVPKLGVILSNMNTVYAAYADRGRTIKPTTVMKAKPADTTVEVKPVKMQPVEDKATLADLYDDDDEGED